MFCVKRLPIKYAVGLNMLKQNGLKIQSEHESKNFENRPNGLPKRNI
jgi:hypothetical protein